MSNRYLRQKSTLPQLDYATRVEGTYFPIGHNELNEMSAKTLSCYAERGIEWIQSYLSLDGTRLIYELNAPDAESVRKAQHRVGVPFDRVWSAMVIES